MAAADSTASDQSEAPSSGTRARQAAASSIADKVCQCRSLWRSECQPQITAPIPAAAKGMVAAKPTWRVEKPAPHRINGRDKLNPYMAKLREKKNAGNRPT